MEVGLLWATDCSELSKTVISSDEKEVFLGGKGCQNRMLI